MSVGGLGGGLGNLPDTHQYYQDSRSRVLLFFHIPPCYVFQVSFVSIVFRHIIRHIFYFHLRSVRYCISVAYFDEAASVVYTRGLAVPFPQCSLFICVLRQYLFRLFRRTPHARFYDRLTFIATTSPLPLPTSVLFSRDTHIELRGFTGCSPVSSSVKATASQSVIASSSAF